MKHSIIGRQLLPVLGALCICSSPAAAFCQGADWKTTSNVQISDPGVRRIVMDVAGTKAVPALLYVTNEGLSELHSDGNGKLIGAPLQLDQSVVDVASFRDGPRTGVLLLRSDAGIVTLYLQDLFNEKTLDQARPISTPGLVLDLSCRLFSGDFNGDSRPDFGVFCNSRPDRLLVAINDGQGSFSMSEVHLTNRGSDVEVYSFDVNHDGVDDLIVKGRAGDGGDATSVLFGSSKGFVPQAGSPILTPSVQSVGDINGDGRLVLVSYGGEAGTAYAVLPASNVDGLRVPRADNGCVVTTAAIGSLMNAYRGILANDFVLAENCGGVGKLVTKGNPASSLIRLAISHSTSRGRDLFTISISGRGVYEEVPLSGQVRVTVDGTQTVSVALNNGFGSAKCFVGAGRHTLTGMYEGDENYAKSAAVLVVHTQASPMVGLSANTPGSDRSSLKLVGYERGAVTPHLLRVQSGAQTSIINPGGLSILNPAVQNCTTCAAPGAPSNVPGNTITAGSGDVIGDVSIIGQYTYNDCASQVPFETCTVQPDPVVSNIAVLIDGVAAGTATPVADDSTYVQCGNPSGFSETCQQGSVYSYFQLPNTLAPGQHTIEFDIIGGSGQESTGTGTATVTYLGASETFSFTLAGQVASTVHLTSSPNPSIYGQTVTLVATVPSGATGTVQFYDSAQLIGAGSVTGGTAIFGTAALGVGSHSLTAVYGGNSSYLSSTSNTVNQIVNAAPVIVTVSGVPNPSAYVQNITISVLLTPPQGGVTPTGTVTITDGNTTLGTVTLNGSGSGSLNVATLAVGSHSIVGSYNGDTNYH